MSIGVQLLAAWPIHVTVVQSRPPTGHSGDISPLLLSSLIMYYTVDERVGVALGVYRHLGWFANLVVLLNVLLDLEKLFEKCSPSLILLFADYNDLTIIITSHLDIN